MEIIDHRMEQQLEYKDLLIGDIYKSYDFINIFMKIAANNGVNAVVLQTGKSVWHNSNKVVIKLNAQLHIYSINKESSK